MMSRGVNRKSAGPPACQEVCLAIGTSRSTRALNSGASSTDVLRVHAAAPREAALQVLGHLPQIAGAHGQHHVAVVQHGAQRIGEFIDALDEHRFHQPAAAHRAADRAPVGAGDRRFAGRIHFRDQEHVAFAEHAPEVVQQIARTRVAMRLKHQHQASLRPALAHRFQRRRHLGGMMAVVVHDQGACRPATGSRPAAAGADRCPGNSPGRFWMASSGISSSVATATAASEFKTLWRPGKLIVTLKGGRPSRSSLVSRLQPQALHIDRANVRALAETVGDEGTSDGLQNALHMFIVGAQHGQTVERQVVQEIDEALLQARAKSPSCVAR